MIYPIVNEYPLEEKNLIHLDNLLSFDYEKYIEIICGEETLIGKLNEIFPFYKNRLAWSKSLIYLKKNKQETKYYYDLFSSILDGLDLTTNEEREKLEILTSKYVEPFGTYQLVPENYIYEYKEEFSQIDLYSFLSSEQKVKELNLNIDELKQNIQERSIFGGFGKHLLGQGLVLMLMDKYFEIGKNGDEIGHSLGMGLVGLALIKHIYSSYFPIKSYDYYLLHNKCLRADVFIKENYKVKNEIIV